MPCFDDNGPICAPLDGEHSSGSGGVIDVTNDAYAMLSSPPSSMAYCSVGDFYAGKTLMITGATGFIGKVMLEKLLRCCPDIRKVFLLVRTEVWPEGRCPHWTRSLQACCLTKSGKHNQISSQSSSQSRVTSPNLT
nr:uncharacterized protein LOC129268642 isoform X2 [Lytechinus pictus]